MKNLLITSAVLAMLATPSLALQLTEKLSFDTTVKAVYSVETDVFAASNSFELNYEVNDGLGVYVDTAINLQDIDFNGANLGVSYTPTSFNKFTVTTEAQFDANLDYSDLVISAELKF
jgi:hypothetical protein